MITHRNGGAARWAIALGLLAAPVAAQADDGRYQVALKSLMILEPEQAPAKGEERAIAPGDVLYKAAIGWADTATSSQDIKVTVAGVTDEIQAGTLLHRAENARGGDLKSLAQKAKIYCGPQRANAAKSIASAMTLGLSSLASRVAKATQLCLVDSDGDAAFDKAFLVGLKKASDRKMVELSPIAYDAQENRRHGEQSYVELSYHDGALLIGPNFKLKVMLDGAAQDLKAIHTELPAKKRSSVVRAIELGAMPQHFDVGPAYFTVTYLDHKTKAARIRYDYEMVATPVALEYRPQTIYVYVPR
jgi:hypothetical protein